MVKNLACILNHCFLFLIILCDLAELLYSSHGKPTLSDIREVVHVFDKVKVGVLRPVQQPGSYWDRSSELPLVGLEPTEVMHVFEPVSIYITP